MRLRRRAVFTDLSRERVGMNADLGPLASGVHVTPIGRLALGALGLAPIYKTNSARAESDRRAHDQEGDS
jgi:hypothetical protein